MAKIKQIRDIADDVHRELDAFSFLDRFPVAPPSVAKVIGVSYVEAIGVRHLLWGGVPVAGHVSGMKDMMIVGNLRDDWKRTTALHLIATTLLANDESHADLAITGAERVTSGRMPYELSADVLAIEIAAPQHVVLDAFLDRFGWAVDDRTDMEWLATNLRSNVPQGIDVAELGSAGRRRRSMLFATATGFGRRYFMPLRELFGLSATAMGIRLEELGLVA